MTLTCTPAVLRVSRPVLFQTFGVGQNLRCINTTAVQCQLLKSKQSKDKNDDPKARAEMVGSAAKCQPTKGKIYDKKPFKFRCIEGKSYLWCTCGWSKTQPFCDSTHKNPHFKTAVRSLKPIRFIAPETKEYLFCNCKQTSKRPFCDGTHKKDEIQAAIRS